MRLVIGAVPLEQQREEALLLGRQRPPERGVARAAVEEAKVELAAAVEEVGAEARGQPARDVGLARQPQRRAAQGHHRRQVMKCIRFHYLVHEVMETKLETIRLLETADIKLSL